MAFKDSELGLIRLRAFGVFNLQVIQPVLFINNLVGTQGIYHHPGNRGIFKPGHCIQVQRLHGRNPGLDPESSGQYDELSEGLVKRLQKDFSHFGLGLTHLYINSITPPPEVQQAIDDRSRMGVFEDMNKLMQMKAAMAMEKASEADGAAGPGMGMGLGLMMPAMFSQYFAGAQPQGTQTRYPARRFMPGLPPFDPPGSKVLPVLRTPATGFQTMRKMQQKSYTQREVLFPMWSSGGRKAKTQGLFKMRQRKFNRIHLL